MQGTRRADIDALRVFGTLAVFAFHCFQPFNPNETWHIRNDERSEILGIVIRLLNVWIMPLFMTLAGFGAYYGLRKSSNREFLRERVMRVLIPLVCGIFLFVAPQVYLERARYGQPWGSFFDGVYPSGNFSWHHLWFLAYLFVYSVVALPVLRALDGWKPPELLFRRGGLLLLAVPLAAFQVALQRHFHQTNALLNDWTWHSQLLLVFIFGYWLASDTRFDQAILRHWKLHVRMALLLTAAYFWLRGAGSSEGMIAIRGATLRFAGWATILALLGGFRLACSRPSTWLTRSLLA